MARHRGVARGSSLVYSCVGRLDTGRPSVAASYCASSPVGSPRVVGEREQGRTRGVAAPSHPRSIRTWHLPVRGATGGAGGPADIGGHPGGSGSGRCRCSKSQ